MPVQSRGFGILDIGYRSQVLFDDLFRNGDVTQILYVFLEMMRNTLLHIYLFLFIGQWRFIAVAVMHVYFFECETLKSET